MFSIYKVSKVVMLGAFLLTGTCVQAMEELDLDSFVAQVKAGTAFKESKEEAEDNTGTAVKTVDPLTGVLVGQVPNLLDILTESLFAEYLDSSKEMRLTLNLLHPKMKEYITNLRSSFKVDCYDTNDRIPGSPAFLNDCLSKYEEDTPYNFCTWLVYNVEFKNLRSVFLKNTDLPDAILGLLHKLTSIGLKNETKVTNTGLKKLTNLTDLYLRDFCGEVKITDEGLEKLTTLKKLGLENMVNKEKLTTLKKLGLENTVNSITNAGLKPLTNLTDLYLQSMEDITVEGFKDLKNLTTLRFKSMSHITDEDLQKFTNLKHLSLDINITDVGLKSLTSLTHLYFNCKGITDTGLKGLTNLTHLSFGVLADITGSSFKFLPSLKTIKLEGCEQEVHAEPDQPFREDQLNLIIEILKRCAVNKNKYKI